MSLLSLLLILVGFGLLLGFVWWAPFIPTLWKQITTGVVAFFLLVWILQATGVWADMSGVRVG